VLPSEVVNRARQKGYALLFARRILFRPIQTFKLLRTLGRHMKFADILRLLSSPFRRRKLNRTPELPAKMIELGLTAPIRAATVSPPHSHRRPFPTSLKEKMASQRWSEAIE
jgi:hypothetical protein